MMLAFSWKVFKRSLTQWANVCITLMLAFCQWSFVLDRCLIIGVLITQWALSHFGVSYDGFDLLSMLQQRWKERNKKVFFPRWILTYDVQFFFIVAYIMGKIIRNKHPFPDLAVYMREKMVCVWTWHNPQRCCRLLGCRFSRARSLRF